MSLTYIVSPWLLWLVRAIFTYVSKGTCICYGFARATPPRCHPIRSKPKPVTIYCHLLLHIFPILYISHLQIISFEFWLVHWNIDQFVIDQCNYFGLVFHTNKLKTTPLCNIEWMRKKTTDMPLISKLFWGVIPVYNMEVLQGRCLREHD